MLDSFPLNLLGLGGLIPSLPLRSNMASARHLLALTGLLFASAVARAEFDFQTQVKPVLENQCVRCHNAEKARGGLRLDTKAGFLKAGENGRVVVRGDLEKRGLVGRIKLPRGMRISCRRRRSRS